MRQRKIAYFVLLICGGGANYHVRRLTSSTLERHLRALWKVTGCCNATLSGHHQPRADDFFYNDPDEEERRFLDQNDISK
jgi:hypothetical protein